MFDRTLWLEARPLFDELVELEPGARSARLEEIGESNPTLRKAVERLLLADVGEEVDTAFNSPASGSPATSSRDPLGIVGRSMSHFVVKDYLATGGMGVVYTAEDLQLGRVVALKFPLPHHRMDESGKARFINEARSAAALDHPNLCTIHEVGESDHGIFLAMPLYPGETLRDRIARDGALPLDEALNITQQIATGLAAAHAAGVVHRDLKPGNVMLLPDKTVKILDFGLAKVRDVSITVSHMTLGTVAYISPEQVRGRHVDARADLWSIGVMLYEMTTGERPFRGDHEMSLINDILHSDPPLASRSNKKLPSELDELITGLLQKDPDARYASADALLADIAALKSGAPLAYRAPFWTKNISRRRIRRWLPLAAAVAVVAIVLVSWNMYWGREATSAVGEGPAVKFVNGTAVVSTSAELLSALSPANAGRRIHLRAGRYSVDRLLVVPDGMTLEGEGAMTYAPAGHAAGFRDSVHTTIAMTSSAGGDLLTLGNKATLRNIEIVDLSGRSGNVIAVASRRAGDTITANIIESVIVNPNPFTIGPSGSFGRGLHITTRNENMGADPGPDTGSVITVKLVRSVIRSPEGGGGWFVFNFAAKSVTTLEISRSLIGGTNEANAGVSRPDAVHDSEVRIISQGNVYRGEWADPCASALLGWNLTGGSGAPIPMQLPTTSHNRLLLRSVNDRIENFTTGILATGSRRFFPAPRNAPPMRNRIDLQLIGTTISTPSCPAVRASSNTGGILSAPETTADLRLFGAQVIRDGFEAGDSNTVHVEMRGVNGSGRRANQFFNSGGPFGAIPRSFQGSGNRLEIIGDRATFVKDNRGIDPMATPDLFSNER